MIHFPLKYSASKCHICSDMRIIMTIFFDRLAAAQVELDAVMATLKEKQDSLAAVEEKVCFLNFICHF